MLERELARQLVVIIGRRAAMAKKHLSQML